MDQLENSFSRRSKQAPLLRQGWHSCRRRLPQRGTTRDSGLRKAMHLLYAGLRRRYVTFILHGYLRHQRYQLGPRPHGNPGLWWWQGRQVLQLWVLVRGPVDPSVGQDPRPGRPSGNIGGDATGNPSPHPFRPDTACPPDTVVVLLVLVYPQADHAHRLLSRRRRYPAQSRGSRPRSRDKCKGGSRYTGHSRQTRCTQCARLAASPQCSTGRAPATAGTAQENSATDGTQVPVVRTAGSVCQMWSSPKILTGPMGHQSRKSRSMLAGRTWVCHLLHHLHPNNGVRQSQFQTVVIQAMLCVDLGP